MRVLGFDRLYLNLFTMKQNLRMQNLNYKMETKMGNGRNLGVKHWTAYVTNLNPSLVMKTKITNSFRAKNLTPTTIVHRTFG